MTTFDRSISAPLTRMAELTVPAVPSQLGVLRAVTRLGARQLRLSDDARADLVLSVDEAAGTLLGIACSPSRLSCTLEITAGEVFTAAVSATTREPLGPTTCSFEWFVLQALVDGVAVEQCPQVGNDNWSVRIVLEKALGTA